MSSTAPASPGDPVPSAGPASFAPQSPASGSGTGPQALSLTERRKAETRMAIARAAARLFVGQGLRATRAEDIARAAGVAPRTFYRYFATKEEAVAPLYALGAERWAAAVREAPPELSPSEALEHAVRHTLTPGAGVSAASWEWARTLIRLAESSPALRKVWAEVCHTTERSLAEVLAERMSGGDDNVAARLRAAPELHFGAAVAGAAVRVAVERWATSPESARSPLEAALRNLQGMRGFTWEPGPAPRG
ncbi:putative tetR-family transcriptional regulator [Streptomyces ambofaciens ATCC 23877]|uniref:Putative tetR-family transcriptional regulator n=1 Tax=Streptomyces ambofaciens (strain ATCC 23877 / 3486 / DSM 40053 / JCM 4204 / NBRC 12836 / NRRL B-2516) TaxID=278992 RepID=A0A0K2ATZ4_STRA7|nr:TetR family transcriptional regulator [Streptomyces ambofaciens]AKZ56297.1 putative tetR-family transcriptional regulator [Streptomyces ambofaciens ATCC 23877]